MTTYKDEYPCMACLSDAELARIIDAHYAQAEKADEARMGAKIMRGWKGKPLPPDLVAAYVHTGRAGRAFRNRASIPVGGFGIALAPIVISESQS